MRLRFLAAFAAFLPTAVIGQTSSAVAPAPDPAGLELPSLDGSDPSVAREGWKFFYFHKAGITYQQARADLTECYRFLPSASTTSGKLPMFVPWEDRQGERKLEPVNNYGIIGAAIGMMIEGPLIRRARQSRLRRCLEPRGYVRYPLPKDSWEKLTGGFSDKSIALQAKAASGPQPNSQPVIE